MQAEAALPSSGSYACITITSIAWNEWYSTAREGLALSNNSIYTEGVGSISRLQKRATHLPLSVALHVPFVVPTTFTPPTFLRRSPLLALSFVQHRHRVGESDIVASGPQRRFRRLLKTTDQRSSKLYLTHHAHPMRAVAPCLESQERTGIRRVQGCLKGVFSTGSGLFPDHHNLTTSAASSSTYGRL